MYQIQIPDLMAEHLAPPFFLALPNLNNKDLNIYERSVFDKGPKLRRKLRYMIWVFEKIQQIAPIHKRCEG
jgi:hypothetical protein